MTLHPSTTTLSHLLTEADLPVPVGAEEITVTGITADSRRIEPGNVFIALQGYHTDARRYIPQAIERGAVAVVWEALKGEACFDAFSVPVSNARVAMACLYDAWYGHPARDLRLVGVTGTNGKTSVSTMLYRILRAAGMPCGLIGTVGCYTPAADTPLCGEDGQPYSGMTTPDPAQLYPLLARMAAETPSRGGIHPVVVMEVTSHALHWGKVAPLRFALSVFTNLSAEHLDLHGTMEDYYATKRKLLAVSREVVINADDRYGRRLLSEPLPIHHYHICHAEVTTASLSDRMCPAGEGGCTLWITDNLIFVMSSACEASVK